MNVRQGDLLEHPQVAERAHVQVAVEGDLGPSVGGGGGGGGGVDRAVPGEGIGSPPYA